MNKFELTLLDMLVKTVRPIRRSHDPEAAKVAARYECKFQRRLDKLTTQTAAKN